MSVIFSGAVSDLEQAIAYELETVDFVRRGLFNQSEEPAGYIEINFSNKPNEDGLYPCVHGLTAISVSIGAGAVREAISRFRPLTFAATFKIQDMIVEWILRANGSFAWQFKEKLNWIEQKRSAGKLVEPGALISDGRISACFWELYSNIIDLRSAMVHGGDFKVLDDGSLEITGRERTRRLSDIEQAAYTRVVCVLAKHLLANSPLGIRESALIESDLGALANIHGQTGLSSKPVRLEALHVVIPSASSAGDLFEVEIDFDLLDFQMKRRFPDATPIYNLDIRAADKTRVFVWSFPPDAVPTGRMALGEVDRKFSKYLQITQAGQSSSEQGGGV